MSDPAEDRENAASGRRLADAIREVRNASADRADVVVDLRDTQRTRLEMLAEELQPVFLEVPVEADWFDFALSSGSQPRLWIDAVAHVTMGRDRRTYRFLRDTRLGRTVLAESHDIRPIADQVTLYIAERMVERQRLIEGDVQPLLSRAIEDGKAEDKRPQPANNDAVAIRPSGQPRGNRLAASLFYAVMGALAGAVIALLLAWERVPELMDRLLN